MNKDISIIKLILEYIESILRTQKRFGNDVSVFKSDTFSMRHLAHKSEPCGIKNRAIWHLPFPHKRWYYFTIKLAWKPILR